MQKLTRFYSNNTFQFWQFIVFSMLYTISTANDYASVMLSIYAKLSNEIIASFWRKIVALNMQGTVFTLERLKIVPSYHQELVSHPMPVYNAQLILHHLFPELICMFINLVLHIFFGFLEFFKVISLLSLLFWPQGHRRKQCHQCHLRPSNKRDL